MSEDHDPAGGDEPSDSYNAADEAQVKERRRLLAITETNKTRFLGTLLRDKLGRALFWEVLGLSQAMGPKYGPTPQLSDHLAGEREHAFQVLRFCMRRQPGLVAQMIAENDHG